MNLFGYFPIVPTLLWLFIPALEVKANRPLAKIAPDGQDAHPTSIIFSCGVGIPPALEFARSDFCNKSNLPTLVKQDQNLNCPAPALERLSKHLVAFGETLESIARQYNLIPATLLGLNPSLRSGGVQVGSEIIIPPFNGIRVEVPANQTWRDVAKAYNVREAILYEVNGCQDNPRVVFVPGVNWSPETLGVEEVTRELTGYPLPVIAMVGLRYGWQLRLGTGKVEFHSGVDLLATPDTPVLAAGNGVVAFAGEQGSYGNLVVINHQDGLQTRYAHLANITVTTGQRITQGEQVGTVGATGVTDIEASHLHFEIRYNSDLGWVAENPEPYLRNMRVANR
jgi:murein DD-endopeptidase MepM/ murein hydrolase activator NlpD